MPTDPAPHLPNHSKPIGLGLIGTGTRLRSIIERIIHSEGARDLRVVSVCEPDPAAQHALAAKLGETPFSFESEEALLENPDVDWVFVGSWNNLHAEQSIRALKAGKHVFCEKPMAISLDDCLAMRDAVEASNRTFAFGLVLRYSQHYQKIWETIQSGRLGRIISFEFNETLNFNHGGHIFGNWRRNKKISGGHMLEKCSHDLDLAIWFSGSVPVKVASFGGKNFFLPENAKRMTEIGPNDKGLDAYKEWSPWSNDPHDPFSNDSDIMDNQVVILEYANGIRATFHTNCNAAIPERRFYILGTHGALRADLVTNSIEVSEIGWNAPIDRISEGETDGHGGGDAVMAESLIQTMLGKQPPLASVQEALRSAITAFAIDQSCEEGRIIDLKPIWKSAGIEF